MELHDLSNQLIPYGQAWQLQKELVEQVCQKASTAAPGEDGVLVGVILRNPG